MSDLDSTVNGFRHLERSLHSILIVFPLGLLLTTGGLLADDWPGFRGRGDSRVAEGVLPLHWTDTNNVAWRLELPGTGQSSPIHWQGVAYVASVAGKRKKDHWILQALDAASGKERWRHTLEAALPEERSDTRSHAAPTPVAGQEGVFAFFEGGECLAMTHAGEVRWQRNLMSEIGEIASNHGVGGSPVLAGDLLVIPIDQEKPSCLIALDRRTGVTRWKASRPGRTAWSSPLFIEDADVPQVVVSGGGTVTSYRVVDGQSLWELSGFVKNLVPSPTLGESLLIIAAGSKGSNAGFAWRGGTNAPVERWRADDVASGFASPLVHRGRVYFVGTAGVVNCREAATGRLLFYERISQSVWASPMAAGDRVYLFGERGSTTVLAASDEYTPLATNRLSVAGRVVGIAACDASILIRCEKELLCIGEANGE